MERMRCLVVRKEGIKFDQEKTLCKDWEAVMKQKERRGGDRGGGVLSALFRGSGLA